MNEQRRQAYLNLIQSLLTCSDGQETNLLDENQELVDEGLVQMMQAVTQRVTETGNENTAQELGANMTTHQEYLEFLILVLQKVSEDPNPQSVYPFLQQNLDKIDETLGQVLEDWARENLRQVNPEVAYSIAIIFNFSTLIQQFPFGNIAINKEIAITGYQIALSVFTFESFPDFWARTQTNLAAAYTKRIIGDKAENLETAIAACHKALQVLTFEAFPQDWARTQNTLANTYFYRSGGDKAENLERAITAYNKALQVFTFDSLPKEWITTQNNLAAAYIYRIRGDKAENLETAIAVCHKALQVLTFEAFPVEWASTQYNFALAYKDRIRGDKAENLETAIAAYKQALRVRTLETFPVEWASTQYNLAVAYEDRIRGDRADNLETAIAYNQKALRVYTFEAFPKEWADTQNCIALVYCERIKGNKAENLETAIAAYTEVLQVLIFEAFPRKWAITQVNLAGTYTQRIREDRADNLELAIAACTKVLQVLTFEAFPREWAMAQYQLGNAYLYRIKEDKSDNLERGITTCTEALQGLTFEVFPYDWANIQNTLAVIHFYRIQGDKADNLEQALAFYHKALTVYTVEAFPQEWARTQVNLSNTYRDRIRGDKAENVEQAIITCTKALTVYTLDAFPQEWAKTQNILSSAYHRRIRGDISENLEQAISVCIEVLKVLTVEAFPQEWATTQQNLAIAYRNRIRGDKAENLESAIAIYHKALTVYTFDAFPQDWAIAQNNLGNAYGDRILGDKANNLERAINYYHNALQIHTKNKDRLNCLSTANNLGRLHYTENNWQEATDAYRLAIEAVETSRLEALNPQRRQEILSAAIVVYHRIVQSYLNLDRPDKALEYVERSKTRELVELLSQRETYPKGISETIKTELDRLRRAIINEGNRLAIEEQNRNNRLGMLTTETREQAILIDYTHLNQLQQQLEEFIEVEITPIDPDFILTQEVKPIPFTEIQFLTDEHTAILEWYITGDKILVFIVTANSLKVWQSSAEDREALTTWINEYLGTYYQNKREYINTLPSRLSRLSELLHINEILEYEELKNIDRLILIPHWFLHLLPLHALPVTLNAEGASVAPLQDKFPKGVSYAPSCQILQRIQNRNRPHFNKLFAIQDPTNDLLYTNLEVETIHTFFSESTILVKEQATETALTNHSDFFNAHCIHFSCHGTFNLASPLQSALKLANNDRLELGEIFQLDLNQCRLIVLSACETGLIDLNSRSDEYVGLPSGFLFAGSQTVVSSLWTVNDLSTAFLMIKFYEQLPKNPQKGEITIALKQAQDWLRCLTCQEFVTELNKYQTKIQQLKSKLSVEDFQKIYDVIEDTIIYLQKLNLHDKPFENPFYWAGFITTGF